MKNLVKNYIKACRIDLRDREMVGKNLIEEAYLLPNYNKLTESTKVRFLYHKDNKAAWT